MFAFRLCIFALFPISLFANSLDTVSSRLFSLALIGDSIADTKTPGYLATLGDNGRFSDLSYATSGGGGLNHPIRLETIAQSYLSATGPYSRDTMVARKLIAGMRYWTTFDLRDANWWYRYIGYPAQFWTSVVLADSILAVRDPAQRTANWNYLLAYIRKDSLQAYKVGANLANMSQYGIAAAAMMRDSALLDSLVWTVTNETRFADKDGIHLDGSFSSHTAIGLQLYSGTYGQEFAKSVSIVAWIVNATPFAFDNSAVNRYELFLLDHVRWLMMGKWIDIGSIGRAIARTTSSTIGGGFAGPIRQFSDGSSTRSAELDAWADSITANKPVALKGNRLYWRHDLMVQRDHGWYASARATSTRTIGNESGSGEGLRNQHMEDGMLLFATGTEYTDIFPVWDWHRLPGVTEILHGNTFELRDWGEGGLGGSAFVGGASDSTAGIFIMRRIKSGVTENKMWLFAPGGVVALGSGISATTSSQVVTTIDQSLADDLITLNGNAIADTFSTTGPAKITMGTRSFFILDAGTPVTGSSKNRSGSWSLINSSGSATTITKKIFTAGFNHGTNPNGAHYAYAIASSTGSSIQVPDDIVVEQNTTAAMVATVAPDSLTGAVFLSAGSVTCASGLVIGLDNPGCVLVRRAENRLSVAVSDPSRLAPSISVSITSPVDDIDTQVVCTLPAGDSAGASRVFSLDAGGSASTRGIAITRERRLEIRLTGNTLACVNAPAGEYVLCNLAGSRIAGWRLSTAASGVKLALPEELARSVYLLKLVPDGGKPAQVHRVFVR